MKLQSGIGLYLSNSSNKNLIIDQIMTNGFLKSYVDLSLMRGALHSTITINHFIEEELRHDRFMIQTNENSGLSSMSSGQQKKALLNYLVNQKPEYLVLDDVYSNIDKETQQSITSSLGNLAATTLMIQIFFRKRDMLPCIETVISIDENNRIINDQNSETFQSTELLHETTFQSFRLPDEYDNHNTDINPLVQLNSLSVRYFEKTVLNKVCWIIQKG